MIGRLNSEKKEATIVGAGISGLLIAYRLKKIGYRVKVLEASDRVGGIIQTIHTPSGIAETAAHSLLVNPEVKLFFDELGVELLPVNADARARYIVRRGNARRIPLNFWEILKTAYTYFLKPKPKFDFATASLEDWSLAHLGKSATQYLMAPFVTGIFASRPSELNLEISFPRLANLHTSKKNSPSSPKKVRPIMMVPKGGMSALIQRLAEELKDEIQLNCSVQTIPESPNIILSVPTAPLSKLIQNVDPVSAALLEKIHYSSLVTMTVFYQHSDFIYRPPRGIGVLMPREQGFRILGVLYNSSAFRNRVIHNSLVSLTVMMGGTVDPEAIQLSDSELKTLVAHELKILLKTKRDPHSVLITRWPEAIPIFSNDLRAAQISLKNNFSSRPGRIIFTNFSREVSIRSLIEATLQL
jgi:oxygen-dependent protoporphyrinogen oxidase